MPRVLKNLKPERVFYFFEEISGIPRGSGNEKGISDYLAGFARERNLEVIQDSYNNIVIRKDATEGYENSPRVVIQGHLDMVCEKNASKVHDFEADPIELIIDGDFIRANGTTLGADNGIAVAYAMALLDSKDIPHPPLEVLLTSDEETGMSGAANLNPEDLKGRILINIDNEEEGQLLVSCAGGMRAKVTLSIEWCEPEKGLSSCKIKVRGLKGGHSGMDIIKQRGNSNKILGRILVDMLKAVNFELASVNGGAKDNAIPREAEAEILVREEDIPAINEKIVRWNKILGNEYRKSDPGLVIEFEEAGQNAFRVFSSDSKEKAAKLLCAIPNGIMTMSMDISGLVQSSTNLGVVKTLNDSISFDSAVRSSVRSLKHDIVKQTEIIGEALGAVVTVHSEYPEWQYEEDSKVRGVFQRVHKEMYGKDAEIVAIHAGVECGLFKEKFPDIDMISFGPNLYDVHTPDEHMSISSVERTWEYLLKVLKEIK
ncbi:MAG: aminoacyl-histidine dipeptidase [Bacillota bacterium]|nr:aminoacyl-histidine dipeptidase [Bacillota bacterium]